MKTQSLAFLLGILLLQNFSYLPNQYWVGIALFIAITIKLIFKQKSHLLIALIFGFAWTLWYAHHQLDWEIPKELEGKTIQVQGHIASLPIYSDHRVSFLFYVKKIIDKDQQLSVKHLLKFSWMSNQHNLKVGDEWRLTVRIKRIHGSMNPGGFDYEGWAFQQGIRGSGYVMNLAGNVRLSSHWYYCPLDRFRQFLQDKIEANLAKSNTSPWIEALILGERHNIAQEKWDVLRNTGTNHLMAIAGLHIGFMAAFAHQFFLFLWRRSSSLVLLIPAQHAGAIAALVVALIYSTLAGFSIPTQRACIMLSVFLMTVLLRRKIIAWQTWSAALFLVLILNPLDVLTESFWLSFGSVALIIYGMSGRLSPKNVWWKWGRIQWVIAVGLIPFSIWLFHQCSIVGFIANSIAIPWVGFLIVPLCLLGCFSLLFSAKLGALILYFADTLLSWLWWILSYLAHLSWASWYQYMPNHYVLTVSCVGMCLLLLPAGFPGRYLGIVWMLPLFFYHPLSPKSGEAWLTLLDVGQGLSAVVQTQKHILIFDAGPRLSENFDMGESVVTPFLYTLNTRQIDKLVISHGDNDHIGGAKAILKNFHVLSANTSVPDMLVPFSANYCLQEDSWVWDKVQFKFLYPSKNELGLGNDSSCVLRITTGKTSIILPGDIEKAAEATLFKNHSELSSQILIAPHHGSKTSARDYFVSAVHPEYVLYAVGYRNRYHFPSPSVVQKYTELGSKQLDTVNSGAIEMKISSQKVYSITEFRKKQGHYWNRC